LSALALESVSAYWGVGWCDPFGPETVSDFNQESHAGNWYIIEQDKVTNTKQCPTVSYTYNKDAWWSFYPNDIRPRDWKDSAVTSGETFLGTPDSVSRCPWGNGICYVKHWLAPWEYTYMILDTDYTSYSM